MAKIHKSNVVQIEATQPIIIHIPNIKITGNKQISLYPNLDVVDVFEESKKKLADSKIDTNKILVESKARIDEACDKAKIDGFQQGYNDGLKKGQVEANTKMDAQIDEIKNNFNNVISKLNQEKENLFATWQDSLLELSLDIAEKIVNIELDRNDDCFHSMVRKAINSLDEENKIILMLCEQDYNRYFVAEDIEYKTRKGTIHVKVEIDTKLKQGDCIVQTEKGYVDCGVDTQLSKIKQNLQEGI